METAVISTNLNETPVTFWVDLKEITKLYDKTHSSGVVVMLQHWLGSESESKHEYYFLKEFLNMKMEQTLLPFHSSIYSITICYDDPYVLKRTLHSSIERTKSKLARRENIESEQISLLITDILESSYTNMANFANIMGSLQETFLDAMGLNFYELFINNKKLTS